MEQDELEKKVQMLPQSLRSKVLEYVNFLIEKKETDQHSNENFSFSWEGGLSELKDQFTSVELQHKVNKWR